MKLTVIIFLFCFSDGFYSQNQAVQRDLQILSHDSMQGRLVGSESEKKCAEHISNSFKTIGLKPFLDLDFYQDFETNYNSNPHDTLLENLTKIKSQNIVGFLDNNSKRTFVIGAHYDHIGRNEYHQSLDFQAVNQIHNGADDNASGVAAVIELARKLSSNGIVEDVNFIFTCFSGEEIGLIGSKHFVEVTENKIKLDLMINMDMISRLDSLNQLFIGGVGTSPKLQNVVTKNKPENFTLVMDSSGIGPSDHTSFYHMKTPVLFFFTGSHEDYHKSSDDFEKINFEGLQDIIFYIEKIVMDLSKETYLEFTPTKTKIDTKKSSFKVTLGIMPNYATFEDGLHVDHVFEGRPAYKAGLERGDIITALNDCKITDIYSYMDCLSQLNKDSKVTISFLRNKEIVKKTVIL
jgi:hypothetical protein